MNTKEMLKAIEKSGCTVEKHWNKGQYIIESQVDGSVYTRATIRFHKGLIVIKGYYRDGREMWTEYTLENFINYMHE